MGDQSTTDPAPPTLDAEAKAPTIEDAEATEGKATEPLGEGGKKALEAERRARKELEARLKELEPLAKAAQEKADAEKTELQKAAEALTSEREARAKAETALLRFTVGADKGVPVKLVQFLAGDTKEAVEASADALLAELGNGERPGVPGKPTERIASGKPSSTLESDDPMALIAKARRHET